MAQPPRSLQRRWASKVTLVVVAVAATTLVALAIWMARGGGEVPSRRGRPLASVRPAPSDAIRVVAAGDICPPEPASCGRTAHIVERLDPDAVLTLGDNQYPDGALEDYRSSYDLTWGAFLSITYAVAGNHEWHTDDAQGYLDYFGGPYWYTFTLGPWRLYALDGTCDENGGCSPGSAQYEWLESELERRSDRCMLGYWHQPRFSSGSEHGSTESVGPLWDLLESAGADLVLNGHEHHYERFAPQDAAGRHAPGGIVEFVVGTGGNPNRYPFGDPLPTSEVRLEGLGVLELALFDGGWIARLVRPNGDVVDQAWGEC